MFHDKTWNALKPLTYNLSALELWVASVSKPGELSFFGGAHLRFFCRSLRLVPVGQRFLQPREDPGSFFGRSLIEDLLQGRDLTRAEEDPSLAQPERLRGHLKNSTKKIDTWGRKHNTTYCSTHVLLSHTRYAQALAPFACIDVRRIGGKRTLLSLSPVARTKTEQKKH